MEYFTGKVALVTGVSSGIGEDIAEDLVNNGMKVVGIARRTEKLQKLEKQFTGRKGIFKAIKCDISNPEEVKSAFEWIEKNWGGITVLINNAAVLHNMKISECDTQLFKQVLDVNILGVAMCSKESIASMVKHKTDGHIININSIVGHYNYPILGVAPYSASKHAVTLLTQTLQNEISMMAQPKIRITSLSPGLVNTAMAFEFTDKINSDTPILQPKDISACVRFVLTCPPNVNITELTVQATGESVMTLTNPHKYSTK